jgi:dihydrofolate reductase
MKVNIIAAVAANRVIGRKGELPWYLPADLTRFKALTTGFPMVMGRKTFVSIGSRPLPGRRTVVITGRPNFSARGTESAVSLPEALARLGDAEQVFVAGGAEVYREALPIADRLYMTWIERDFAGDTYFPEFDLAQWELVEEEVFEPSGQIPFAYRFSTYDRKRDDT